MTLQEFTLWANGKKLAKYNDGQYPGQCVSLINQYCWRVLNVPAASWGNAKDWGFNATTLRYFNKVSSKQPGDILVYPGTASNPYGHIEIFIGNGQALQQNRFLDGMTHISPVWSKAPIAILRSKTPKENSMIVPDQDNWFWRFNKLMLQIRGRGISRDEFRKNFVGVEVFKMVEIVSDDPEADRATNWQSVGQVAVRDNWQGQITTLLQANRQLKEDQNKAANEVAALTQENADLKAQLAVQSADTTNLNSLGVLAQWFIKRLGLK